MDESRPFEHYSPATRFIFRVISPLIAFIMESRLRRKLNDPVKTLKGAGIRPGQKVLEVGCGTGYFTIPAARMVGEGGIINAIDIYPASIECVSRKAATANLINIRLTNADAMASGLPDSEYDLVLLLGVVPAPMLPLGKLLPEMYRLLRPEGTMAVWTIPWWSPESVTKNGLFTYTGKKNGVHNFRKVTYTGN